MWDHWPLYSATLFCIKIPSIGCKRHKQPEKSYCKTLSCLFRMKFNIDFEYLIKKMLLFPLKFFEKRKKKTFINRHFREVKPGLWHRQSIFHRPLRIFKWRKKKLYFIMPSCSRVIRRSRELLGHTVEHRNITWAPSHNPNLLITGKPD